jgi:adenosine 3'-phospho 5'-phosphosulfate transporter B3
MSLGLVFFTLADNSVSPNWDLRGYAMISLALVADAIIGNVQEKAMKSYKASNSEVVFYSYFIGSAYLFIGTILSGELFHAFVFFAKVRFTLKNGIGLASGSNLRLCSNLLTYWVLGHFGCINVSADARGTFSSHSHNSKFNFNFPMYPKIQIRKAVTIVLSFVFFAKPFTVNYLFSGLLVLLAIYLNVYSKNSTKIDLFFRKWLYMRKSANKEELETFNV